MLSCASDIHLVDHIRTQTRDVLFRELVVAHDAAHGLREGDVLAAIGDRKILVNAVTRQDVPCVCQSDGVYQTCENAALQRVSTARTIGRSCHCRLGCPARPGRHDRRLRACVLPHFCQLFTRAKSQYVLSLLTLGPNQHLSRKPSLYCDGTAVACV